MEEFSAKH